MKRFFNKNKNTIRDYCIIIAVFLLASAVLYGYYQFFTDGQMTTLYRNWDGPGYRIVARTLYSVDLINKVNPFPFLPPTHYAYQFPLYPVFIRMFSFIGYNQSMIFVSQMFSLLFILAFYRLLKTVNPGANALIVSLLLVFYTPRWFIVSHVGSAEPVFLFFLTLFLLFFLEKKYLLSAVFAGLSQMTKSQGIIFFIGIATYYVFTAVSDGKKSFIRGIKGVLPFLLIPLVLIGVFSWYYRQYGDFFVYFGITQLYHHTQLPLLKILTATQIYNISTEFCTVWKESYVFNYVLYLLPIVLLIRQKSFFLGIVGLVYYLPLLFLVHPDVSRLSLPLLPFMFLGYSDALSKKPLYLTLFLCTPAVFLYALGFISYNLAPLPFQ